MVGAAVTRLPLVHLRGFTLIECLVALSLMALVLSLAAPSWTQAWRQSKRLEATAALWRLHHLQEQYRWRTGNYATEVSALLGQAAGTAAPSSPYTLEVAQASVHGYTLVARPRAGSTAQQDSACHTLALRQHMGEFSRGSACASCDVAAWALADGNRLSDPARCWGA